MLGAKYYTVVPGKNALLAFNVEDCEGCGKTCQASNAFWLYETRQQAERLGLRRLNGVSDELSWSDAFEGALCTDCCYY